MGCADGARTIANAGQPRGSLQSHRFDLLVIDQQVIGLIETAQQDCHLLIVNVAVDPEVQRRGFGQRLIAHVERLASTSGLAGTRLYTNSQFTENIRLYTALGCSVEREEALNGGIAVHMFKALDATQSRS